MKSLVSALCGLMLVSSIAGPQAAADQQRTARWAVCGSWREVPLHGDTGVHATDVAVVSPTEAWLAGVEGELFRDSVVFHWNGTRWSEIPFPVPDTGPTAPADDWWVSHFTVVASDEVWAVGGYSYYKASGLWVHKPLIARWDGSRWRLVHVGIPALHAILYSVATVPGTDDLWAVGARYRRGDNSMQHTVALSWNGDAWRRVATPDPSGKGNRLYDVFAENGVAWAVGSRGYQDGPSKTLVLRWNGDRWATQPTPTPGHEGAGLVSVTGAGGRAWAVGTTYARRWGVERGFVMRWIEGTWRIAFIGASGSSLQDVLATSPTDVWAVGQRDQSATTGHGRVLVLRRHDHGWHRSPTPDLKDSFQAIDGTPHNLWAAHSWVRIDSSASDTYHRC